MYRGEGGMRFLIYDSTNPPKVESALKVPSEVLKKIQPLAKKREALGCASSCSHSEAVEDVWDSSHFLRSLRVAWCWIIPHPNNLTLHHQNGNSLTP